MAISPGVFLLAGFGAAFVIAFRSRSLAVSAEKSEF
jgi:hypothetical protein